MRGIRSKLLAILLTVMVAMTYSVPAFADDVKPDASADSGEKIVQEEKETEPAKEETKPEVEETKPEVKETEPVQETKPEVSEPAQQEKEETSSDDAGSTDSDAEDPDQAEKKSNKGASTGNATYEEVSNATSLADGEYKASSFSFTGGTGKTAFSCDKVIVSGGKAKAVIRVESTKYTHLFTGKTNPDKNTDAENKDLYDPSDSSIGKGVYKMKADGSGMIATIPVSLGSEMNVSGRTTAMSEAHWIAYKITVDATAEDRTGDAAIEDGTYKPDSFSFTGGTGKATMTCEKVIVKDGKATAVFKASSEKMTHLYMDKASSNNETTSLYDPKTDTCGKDVYKIYSQNVAAPVELNQEKDCAVRTTAMSEPHWVNYTYKITLTPASEKISDSTEVPDFSGGTDPTNPEDPSQPTDPTNPDDPEDPGKTDPTDTKKLGTGTWKVKATTSRDMFYLYPKETDPAWTILKVKKDKSMTATITLSGDGYDYVYMGTATQAKKASKKNWIKAKVTNGYYTFKIPVSALDKKLKISPHSHKYATDGDPSTEPWRDGKWIIFYSNGAKKVKDGTTIKTGKKKKDDSGKTSGTQKKFKNDKKADKVSKWKDDANKSTSAVDNSTSLKDGVYTPDKFHWSGGSGRLAYIRCNKITVRGGKAYATIEFGSSKYDSLKANGSIYSKQGGGNSKFVIPVKLNANNTIIGRTTAMSQPHWVKYTIFVYKAGANAASKNAAAGTDGHVTNTKKLTDKAPDLLGLKSEGAVEVKYAKYFKIFKYEQGITLVCIDQSTGTALKKAEKDAKASEGKADAEADSKKPTAIADKALEASKPTQVEEADAANATQEEMEEAAEADANAEASANEEKIEYDEEGKPIAKTDSERTNDLYKNDVVNYLIVPKGVELPAGLEKDCVILEKPVKDVYVASPEVVSVMADLSQVKSIGTIGMSAEDVTADGVAKAVAKDKIKVDANYENPDFRQIIQQKTGLVILPAQALPEKVTKKSSEEEKALSEEQEEILQRLQTRYSALNIPMMVDRSAHEKSTYAKAEWTKVYGAIFGEEKAADAAVDKYVKEHKNEKIGGK